jgi:hypothetical protein
LTKASLDFSEDEKLAFAAFLTGTIDEDRDRLLLSLAFATANLDPISQGHEP